MRHLKLKQGVCGMATHTREIHQCSLERYEKSHNI